MSELEAVIVPLGRQEILFTGWIGMVTEQGALSEALQPVEGYSL